VEFVVKEPTVVFFVEKHPFPVGLLAALEIVLEAKTRHRGD
jgi:hypothetical protein